MGQHVYQDVSLRPTVIMVLAGVAMVLAPGRSFAQDTPPPSDSGVVAAALSKWNVIDGDWGRAALLGAMMTDFYRYRQDDASLSQVGDLSDFEIPLIRMLRLGAIGQFNLGRPWTWLFSAAYRGFDRGFDRRQTDTWSVFDLALRIPVDRVGTVGIGRQKDPFSIERLANGLYLPFMERAAGLDALLASRNNGVTLSNTIFDRRMTWSVGWFPGWLEVDEFFARRDQYGARVTGLVLDGNKNLLHLGVSTRLSTVRQGRDGVAQFGSRPESFGAPKFVDTGEFPAGHLLHFGGEAVWRRGRFWIDAETVLARVDVPTSGDPTLWSFHTQAGWVLTGESRLYDRNLGIHGPWVPSNPVTDGGPGLWEIAVRYSHTDLEDGAVTGGVLDRWTGGISWVSRGLTKVSVNYGVARLNRDRIIGYTQILQARLQLAF